MQGVLHWVAEPSPRVDPLKVEVRLFDKLFLSENPAELDEWLCDLNPQSKIVVLGAYSVPLVKKAAVGDTFQFERLGMFQIENVHGAWCMCMLPCHMHGSTTERVMVVAVNDDY
ncbi:hypothetical protein F0562_034064 [Nyssa sinensis]|uniref:tRNA synthetases class I (E and Q) anti-codon binding domain-containing protein n=1 Tax=Nyssa sinensis TaxID=561372 RepID=A0A5J5AI76_9ASTE|nr:hypothetical protein F0562_034064 [Nyssa sinensis]